MRRSGRTRTVELGIVELELLLILDRNARCDKELRSPRGSWTTTGAGLVRYSQLLEALRPGSFRGNKAPGEK
jgi:hypothetical protein